MILMFVWMVVVALLLSQSAVVAGVGAIDTTRERHRAHKHQHQLKQSAAVQSQSAVNKENSAKKNEWFTGAKFAIFTYCSCDKAGCFMYETPTRLKDLYCKQHGCDHIVMTPSTKPKYESQNHFDMHAALLSVMESPKQYDYILHTDGDQVIVNVDIAPGDLIPPVCRSEKYDLFLPFDEYSLLSGMCDKFLIRNTAAMRDFLRELIEYPSRGHYVISAQTAMNHLVLKHIVQRMNASTDGLEVFERGGKCDMYLPDEYYNYKYHNQVVHYIQHEKVGKCLASMFGKYYGKPYVSRGGAGRRNNSICIFNSIRDGGQNWNNRKYLRVLEQKQFMVHMVGNKSRYFSDVENRYDQVLDTLSPQMRQSVITSPSSVYDKCVKPFL